MRVFSGIRTWGWLVAIAVAYLYIFPYFPKIHSANELPRIYLVKAMVHDGTFAIDAGVKQWGTTVDVSPHGDHQYSNKSPGSSLLAAPAETLATAIAGEPSLAESMWLARVTTGIVPTLVFLWLLYGFLARFAPEPSVRRLVVVAYGLGSMAMTYSLLYYSHQLSAVCVGCAWILIVDVAEGKRAVLWAALAGVFAGAAPLVDYQALFATVPVGVYAIATLVRRDSARQAGVVAALAVGGAAIPIAVLLAYHTVCFGSPWKTGYDASTTFAVFHQQGFLGMTELKWERFTGSMVAPDNGLLTLAPWLAAAVPGAIVLGRRQLGHALTCTTVIVIYVLFVSSLTFWRGGWGVGPRYITVMLPFALPLVAVVVQRSWEAERLRPLWIGLEAAPIVAAVSIYALSSATFPYWPDSVKNPVVDVTGRLLYDGLVGPNAGGALGIAGVAGIIPYLVVVAGVLAWAIWRAAERWWGVAIAFALGAGMLAAFQLFPRGSPEHAYAFVKSAVGP